jgi:ribose/xylose/arabinose/galactoside ABC-type transport system permease subunit
MPASAPSIRVERPRPRLRLSGETIRVFAPLVGALIVLSLYTGQRNSIFLTADNFLNILLQVSVLGALALGQTYLLTAGQLDLSVAAQASFVSVLGATMLRDGSSEPMVVIVCLVLGALVGLVWGLTVSYMKVPPFILTLGGLSVFRALAQQRANNTPVPMRDRMAWLGNSEIFGMVRTPVFLVIVLVVISMIVFRYTAFGRQLYAVGSSEEAAYLAGLPTNRTKVLAFVISSTLASFAGLLLLVRIGAGDPRAGTGFELQAVAAVVLGGGALAGGRGSPLGTYLGVVVLGTVAASMTFLNMEAALTDLVLGGVLIFAVTSNALADLRRDPNSAVRVLVARMARRRQPTSD